MNTKKSNLLNWRNKRTIETADPNAKVVLSDDTFVDLSELSIDPEVEKIEEEVKQLSETVTAQGEQLDNVEDTVAVIEGKIPVEASSQNQLADKDFVNESVTTASAAFKGTYNSLQELEQVEANANDYGFVIAEDLYGNTRYDRYKYTEEGWLFEYSINSVQFSSSQWSAINSGIDDSKVSKLNALPTKVELDASLDAKANKSEMSVSTNADKTTIALKAGTSAEVINAHQDISGKQDLLISGTNIKTINGESVLGNGGIVIQSPEQSDWYEKDDTSMAYIVNRPGIDVKNNNTTDDLDIVDQSGNVLVRFLDGHMKTKNFDSSETILEAPADGTPYVRQDESWVNMSYDSHLKKNWLTCAHRGNIVGTSLRENTLAAFFVAAEMGCDLIECDARACSDGTLFCNHDATVTDYNGNTYTIANITSSTAENIVLSDDDTYGTLYLPTLEQVLNLCYYKGIKCNIDLKNNGLYATEVANLVLKCGMRGKVYYATNNAPYTTIEEIAQIDEGAKFIGSMSVYTDAFLNNLSNDLRKRCVIYSHTPSDVDTIRNRGVSALLTSVTSSNISTCLTYHPEILEYNHTEDFKTIETDVLKNTRLY